MDDFKTPAKVIGVARPAVTDTNSKCARNICQRIVIKRTICKLYSNGKVRIETPIPGKQAVGIEIPNNTIEVVR